jgi:alpha-amylase/alpha-mannosidase (GH57 family)
MTTKNQRPLLCIHGHFYQPPREDPFTGEYRREPSAAPYQNWNERITSECYAPNTTVGNFERISFNLGGTLARWMERHAHDTYTNIVTAAHRHRSLIGQTNAVAQSVHHTILPLARRRDKRCQVQWGIASFQHRFGHLPVGMWLPEMAVDRETLDVVAEAGLQFVILSDEQVEGDRPRGAGPYAVKLAEGRQIAVFIRDRGLSDHLSFQMPAPRHAREWMNDALRWRRPGELSLVATDGETFGHHHRQGVAVLQNLTETNGHDAYEVTTLARVLQESPPTNEVLVRDNTAWSCSHHLGRWVTGCGCTPGCGHWKGALRRALDNLSHEIDGVFAETLRRRNVSPWWLRDHYIHVLLGEVGAEQFLAEHYLTDLSSEEQRQVIGLLEAQVHRQRMFVSCTFFFEELERIEPRYAIANAVRAMALIYYATGDDLTRGFRRDLGVTLSAVSGRTGADILDELLEEARFGDNLMGDMALSRADERG